MENEYPTLAAREQRPVRATPFWFDLTGHEGSRAAPAGAGATFLTNLAVGQTETLWWIEQPK